jgi:hypothetical protein
MPIASRVVADVLSVSIENGFRIVTWIAIIAFLICVFALARYFTEDYRHALVTMVILGLSFTHIKFPLMVVAFWALIAKRFNLCLLVSSIGLLFFKEWFDIPILLVLFHLGRVFWHSRSKRSLVHFVVVLGIALGAAMIPRLCIPVSKVGEWINPRDLRTLGGLFFPTGFQLFFFSRRPGSTRYGQTCKVATCE